MSKSLSVVGAILVVSIICIGLLTLVSSHYVYDPQKYAYVGRYIGELFGGVLFLTIAGSIAAGIAALIQRKHPYKVSIAIKTGTTVVILLALANWMASTA